MSPTCASADTPATTTLGQRAVPRSAVPVRPLRPAEARSIRPGREQHIVPRCLAGCSRRCKLAGVVLSGLEWVSRMRR